MTELRPCLVTAPLTIQNADKLDTNTIYIFDYENSFKDSEDKPKDFISYIEMIGGMVDIFVAPQTDYFIKEKLLLNYINSGSFYNVYTLVSSLIQVMFVKKDIDMELKHSFFNKEEAQKFIDRNYILIKKLETFYNSLFLLMILFAGDLNQSIKHIKKKFPTDKFCDDEFGPNVCSVLIDKDFYKYYDKHIGNNVYYYTFMYDNNLYRGKSILDILNNQNNDIIPVLVDLNNKKFQEFISANC